MSEIIESPAVIINGGGMASQSGSIVNSKRDGRFQSTGALTHQQRRFVSAYVGNGGNGEAAKATAGYKESVRAWTVLQSASVRTAIKLEREKVVDTQGGSLGLKTVMDLARDEEAPKAVRLKAGIWLYEQAHPKATEALPAGGKPLSEMSIDELSDYISKGKQTLLDLEKVATGTIIEIPAEPSHATTPDAQEKPADAHNTTGETA